MAQNDVEEDRDRVFGSSPTMSLSPTLSGSPMPFLGSVESAFTPPSTYYGGSDVNRSFSFSECDSNAERAYAQDRSIATVGADRNSSWSPARATGVTNTVHAQLPNNSDTTATNTNNTETEYEVPILQPAFARANGDRGPKHQEVLKSALKKQIPSVDSPPKAPDNTSAATITTSVNTACTSATRRASDDTPVILKPKPLIRTASTKGVSLRHPAPDITLPSPATASSIANLEATAERLSMTSSIEDAIRELHDEQKQNDSRRSSILAAAVASSPDSPSFPTFPFARHVSSASSIVETNSTARSGGYSPAGFILSPTHSLRSNGTRLRSGSNPKSIRSDADGDNQPVSRHGPGKSSVRSVRSATKPTLGDIAELPTTALTSAAMDEADKMPQTIDIDQPIRIPQLNDDDRTPNAHDHGSGAAATDYWDHAVAQAQQNDARDNQRSPTPTGSASNYDHAENAFADFDGAYYNSDNEDMPFMADHASVASLDPAMVPNALHPGQSEHGYAHASFMAQLHSDAAFEPSSPVPSLLRPGPRANLDGGEQAFQDLDQSGTNFRHSAMPRANQRQSMMPRPQSYLDPSTGNTMLYYPARVPMMLNLPQKLSKKPNAAARNNRRSEILKPAPVETNRKSVASWLPEIQPDEQRFDPLDQHSEGSTPQPAEDNFMEPTMSPRFNENGEAQPQLRQPPKLANAEARKSHMPGLESGPRHSKMPSGSALPPQLRASAFFDLPSQEMPEVELKDGSAAAALDSILDASATAPVSAFTDHAFAGTLGHEVYGVDKKRKSHMPTASTGSLGVETNKRKSFLHRRKSSGFSKLQKEDKRNTIAASPRSGSLKSSDDDADERQALAASVDGRSALDPAEDRVDGNEEEEQEEEEEIDPLYHGPPTTLLAELQIRKAQNKMRTRPIAQAYPNGLHSTLLELDTVAEIQHQARKGKKVNLAWEGQDQPDEESDDEDTPLGVLMASRGQHGDAMVAAMAELNRPMGLIERRDAEENEPLSRRRARLQGHETLPTRQSMMQLGNASGLRMNHTAHLAPPSPRFRVHTPEEDEEQEETLRERMQRLRAQEEAEKAANPLPETRPVSMAFTAELMEQWAPEEKEEKKEEKEKDKPEEEETLGQRRRRLQAEREAAGETSAPPLRQRHSLADVLGTYGARSALTDPRAEAAKRRQKEHAIYSRDQGNKLAAFRSNMPTNVSTPNLQKPGGFMAGRFNDGLGGNALGQSRNSVAMTGLGGGAPGLGFGGPGAGGAYAIPQMQTGSMDRVERWRQSVMQ